MSQELAPSAQSISSQFDRKSTLTVANVQSTFRGNDGRFERGEIYWEDVKFGTYEVLTYDKGLLAARIPPGPVPQPPFKKMEKRTKADDLKPALKDTWIFDLKVRDTSGHTVLEVIRGQWITGNPETNDVKELINMFSERFPAPKPAQPVFHGHVFATLGHP